MAAMPDTNLPTRTRAGLRVVYLTTCHFHDRSQVSGIARYPLNVARGVAESSRGYVYSRRHRLRQHPGRPGRRARGQTAAAAGAGARGTRGTCSPGELPAAIAGGRPSSTSTRRPFGSASWACCSPSSSASRCASPITAAFRAPPGVFADQLDLADRVVCYSDYGASLLMTRTPDRRHQGRRRLPILHTPSRVPRSGSRALRRANRSPQGHRPADRRLAPRVAADRVRPALP